MSKRRVLTLSFTVPMLAALALAACASTNGAPIPNEVFDATPIDTGTNPGDPDGDAPPDAGKDAREDASSEEDAADDAPVTLPVVVINELYVDRISDGDGAEFVELRATPGAALDDLKLRLVYPSGQVKYEVAVAPAGTTMGPSGFWVVGGSQTFKLRVQDRVDHQVPITDWGLDYPGAVQLVRGATVLDVVGYSTDADGGAPPLAMPPPSKSVEGKAAIVPTNAGGTAKRRSFGRKAAAVDTDDNRADFCTMEASPGYAQKPCE